MAIIKCKMCGGDLNLVEGASTAECEYCGSVQTIPNLDDEKKLIQFERAERLRKQCEFDKAAGIYENIVADFRQEAEAYWGLVLCKYGIEYVDDPATGKKIPTCHRSSFDSIMEDGDFEQVLENADGTARRVYRDEAKAIEELRKGIIAVSANEQPYDIFICYKETAEDGDRTLDSVLAQDVYDALTDKGYRVFFSRISLEDKLGVEYEPYIFAALNSAKIMLAFGTDYEYFNAVWVKNEWSRFLKLMAKDKDKHLIPCYKGIDAYDMPKEFAKLQAQDLGKIGAIQDLLRGIEKILPRGEAGAVPATPMTVVSGIDLDALLKRGWMALEDGAWNEAARSFDQVLDRNPESVRARLGNYLAGMQIRDMAEAERKYEALFYTTKNDSTVKRIRNLADAELTAWFQRLDAKAKDRAEQELRRQECLEQERLAQKRLEQERREQERIEREQRIAKLESIREKQKTVQKFISAGARYTVGLKIDGTTVAIGTNYANQCGVSGWTGIVAVSGGDIHTVGVKADGTVVAAGWNSVGQSAVSDWTDIIAISACLSHTAGLKKDGTLVATKYTGDQSIYHGHCDVSGWKDIIAISTGDSYTVGLKKDGTVAATKYTGNQKYYYGQCGVSQWTEIVAISAGVSHTVGLKKDGTAIAVGRNNFNQCNVSGWGDIVAISAGEGHTVGLKYDGTVVAVGCNDSGQCNVSDWENVVAISAGKDHTVGLRHDGTVVAVGCNDSGQCNVSGWKLFQDYEKLEEEQQEQKRKMELAHKEAERIAMQQRSWRNAGRCQHCGGDLKGLFTKKCVFCGKPKDY